MDNRRAVQQASFQPFHFSPYADNALLSDSIHSTVAEEGGRKGNVEGIQGIGYRESVHVHRGVGERVNNGESDAWGLLDPSRNACDHEV